MIIRLLASLAAFGPASIMLAYGFLRLHGDWRNEAVWVAFAVGGMVGILAVAVELVGRAGLSLMHLPPLSDAAIEAAGIAALPEETAKFIVVVLALNHVDARRMRDVALIALAAALGFAAFENFFYIVGVDGWSMRAVIRAGTAVPEHALDGLAMGAFLTLARLSPQRHKLWLCLALAVPICLHAAYDFPLLALRADHAWWIALSWPVVLLGSAIGVTILSDRTTTAAIEWDREHKLDANSHSGAFLAATGTSFVAIGILLAVSVHFVSDQPRGIAIAIGATVGFLPIFFGGNLLRLGIGGGLHPTPLRSVVL